MVLIVPIGLKKFRRNTELEALFVFTISRPLRTKLKRLAFADSVRKTYTIDIENM